MAFFVPFQPLLPEKRYKMEKNIWGEFYCIFHDEAFAKNPIKIQWKIKKKFFWPSPPTPLTPIILKTVRDSKNPMEYVWKHSLRGIQWKKSHRNRIKNKNFPHGPNFGAINSIFRNCDLDLWPTDPKINSDLALPNSFHLYKFCFNRARDTQVIIRKRNPEWRNDRMTEWRKGEFYSPPLSRKAGDNKRV